MTSTSVATGAPTLHNLSTYKDANSAQLSPKTRTDALNTRDTTLMSQRDTVHVPVPEDDVLNDDTVFADSNAQAVSIAAGQAARQQQQKQRSGLLALLTCSCFSDASVPEVSDSRNASGAPRFCSFLVLLLDTLEAVDRHSYRVGLRGVVPLRLPCGYVHVVTCVLCSGVRSRIACCF
jgi:hypothetical protein